MRENHPTDILFREGHEFFELEKKGRAVSKGGGEVSITEGGAEVGLRNPEAELFQ